MSDTERLTEVDKQVIERSASWGTWRRTIDVAWPLLEPTTTCELGMGLFSTPYFAKRTSGLHVAIEAERQWYDKFAGMRDDHVYIYTAGHQEYLFVPEMRFDLVLVDPALMSRLNAARRLKKLESGLIVIHDSDQAECQCEEMKQDSEWGWVEDSIFPQPSTLTLSRDRALLAKIKMGLPYRSRRVSA